MKPELITELSTFEVKGQVVRIARSSFLCLCSLLNIFGIFEDEPA
jgi:hypothetical protein